MKKIRILIADANRLLTDSLRMLLEREGRFAVTVESASGVEAVRRTEQNPPDITVVGQRLNDISMYQVAREVRRRNKSVKFFFIVEKEEPELLKLLSENENIGAMKECEGFATLLSVLDGMARGERYIGREILNQLRNGEERAHAPVRDPLEAMTNREREVLYWIAQGLTNEEISKRMYLSENTVKIHVNHILKKLSVTDRTKAAAIAWKDGFAMIPEEFFSQRPIG